MFSPFYSEKCKYSLGMKIVFGVIGTLISGAMFSKIQVYNFNGLSQMSSREFKLLDICSIPAGINLRSVLKQCN